MGKGRQKRPEGRHRRDIRRILKTHVPEPLSAELAAKFNEVCARYGVPGITT